jgi:threonine synthase
LRYVSTRGEAPVLAFSDALLAGLARDGGLYLPESWPRLGPAEIRALAGKSYADIAVRIMTPFLGGRIGESDFADIVSAAYAAFRHPAVAPLKQLDSGTWLMELFHGPTLAFKDVAMQLLARLMDRVLAKRGRRATIIGATSGDTGGAAIEAFRGSARVDVVILYPEGRVSDVQRRMMTTPTDTNVHAVAVRGTFDDCQALVKGMFNDHAFRDRNDLSGVNSINWARIAGQLTYYFAAAAALDAPKRAVSFVVPTGNFGDIFAGYLARNMGLPINQLIVATNRNDILHRFMSGNQYVKETLHATLSPSMDIMVSSNFERLLFDLHGRNGAAIAGLMDSFKQGGGFSVEQERWTEARKLFDSLAVDDAQTCETIAEVYEQTGELLDPHTAIGVKAARECRRSLDIPMVILGTAHPVKFPDAVEKAGVGKALELPVHLADLFERDERCTVLPNDLKAVQAFVSQHGNRGKPL